MKKLMLGFLFAGFSFGGFAQSDVMPKAFENSYSLETAGRYEEAIGEIMKVHDTEDYPTNLRLGWLYYQSGDYPTAVKYYEKAIALAPGSVEARLGYVYPAAALEHWDDVVRMYGDILKFDPGNATANYRLGYIYYYRKDYPLAKKYLEPLVGNYPFDYDGVILLAWTYFQLGKAEQARRLFNRTLMISPGDESALEGLKSIQ